MTLFSSEICCSIYLFRAVTYQLMFVLHRYVLFHLNCDTISVKISIINQDKSTASLCSQVAAWFPDMFCDFQSIKNHRAAKNSSTTEAQEKICEDLKSVEFQKNLDTRWSQLNNNLILLNKISHRFLFTTKVIPG